MKMLWITSEIPYPPNRGYPMRIYNLLRRLSLEHEIYLFTLKRFDEQIQNIEPLKEICKEVGFTELQKSRAWSRPLDFFSFLIRGIPPEFRFYLTPAIRSDLLNFIKGKKFDIVEIEDLQLALWRDLLLEHLDAKTVLDFQDIYFHKFGRIYRLEKKLARRLRIWLHSRILKKWEPEYSGRFDLCLTISDLDKKLLQDANPRIHAETLSNGIELDEYQITPIQNPVPRLLYIGNMNYLPNIDAVTYFVEQIFPYVRQQIPSVEFHIVGNNAPPSVWALAGKDVLVTGEVFDVQPYYQNCWISVVPLRAGGGIRNKILEAMALGRPTVSTSIGCEGLKVTHEKDILISDDPHEFAEHVVRLIKDDELRSRLIENGRKTVEAHYNWDVIARRAESLYRSLFV